MAYILQLLPVGTHCCASSTSADGDPIKIFDLERGTDKPVTQLEHAELGRVNQLVHPTPSLLLGCFSSSSVVLGWDFRTDSQARPALHITGQSTSPFISLAHSHSNHLVAAGSSAEEESSQIELFDLRASAATATPLCIYDQSHSDSITCLDFCPADSAHQQLLSASTDGLLVLHDTNETDQDQSILFTHNTGASLAHAHWQPDANTIWAGSDMETLSRWDNQLSLVKDYGDLRQDCLAKPDPTWQQPVSYLISLTNPSPTRSAYFAGSQSGDVVLVETTQPETHQWQVLGSFKAGHTEMVRCAAFDPQNSRALTGAEDGQICIWSIDPENPQSGKLLHRFTPFPNHADHSDHRPNLLHPKPDSGLKTVSSKDHRFKPYTRP